MILPTNARAVSSNDVINISDVTNDKEKIIKLSSATEHRHLPVRLQPSLEVKCKPEHATEVQVTKNKSQCSLRATINVVLEQQVHVLFLRVT